MIEIALFQPDIAANAGSIGRMCACFGLPLTIIEPAGFPWSDSAFRRAGMDYLAAADIRRSPSWEQFLEAHRGRRLVLTTTKGTCAYTNFQFNTGDILITGRETSGVPEHVHAACQPIMIPMRRGMRSLNVAMAAAIVAAEAMRQLGCFAKLTS